MAPACRLAWNPSGLVSAAKSWADCQRAFQWRHKWMGSSKSERERVSSESCERQSASITLNASLCSDLMFRSLLMSSGSQVVIVRERFTCGT